MELAGSTKQIQVLLFFFFNIFNSWLWFVESLGAGSWIQRANYTLKQLESWSSHPT